MNKKNVLVTASAMALTAAMTIGGTLAYLSSVTQTETNVFSSSRNVSSKLEETEFKKDSGSNYTPGKAIFKNPTMENTSTDEDIWVAVSLQYVDSADHIVSQATFAEYATIQYKNGVDANGGDTFADGVNTDAWKLIGTADDGSELYLYKAPVLATDDANTAADDTVTTPIFDQVVVNTGITSVWKMASEQKFVYTLDAAGNLVSVTAGDKIVTDNSVIYYDAEKNPLTITSEEQVQTALPTFEIAVKGYAIQTSDVNEALATSEIIGMANDALGYTAETGF